jgi:hypothetical protein
MKLLNATSQTTMVPMNSAEAMASGLARPEASGIT